MSALRRCLGCGLNGTFMAPADDSFPARLAAADGPSVALSAGLLNPEEVAVKPRG